MIKIEKECPTCKGIGQIPDIFNKGSFRDCSNRYHQVKKGKSGPYCSKSCTGTAHH